MNSLKKIQKPMILEIIQIFSAHPFILTALACFFCVSVSSANISAVSTFIPSAVLSELRLFPIGRRRKVKNP